jgi:hypothetical protein
MHKGSGVFQRFPFSRGIHEGTEGAHGETENRIAVIR